MNDRGSTLQRLAKGTYSSTGERLDFTYFDTIPLSATAVDYSYFQQQLGAGGKTLADTNMISAGQLPQGQKFRIKTICIEYLSHATKISADIDLLYNFLQNATVRFFISGKDALYSKPLTRVMGFSSLFHVIPSVAGNNEVIMSMGRHLGIDPLNKHITLAALTNFEVRITIPTALGAISLVADRVRVNLNGILVRAS